MSDTVPAGWYPMPDGKQRYWDGTKWTNLPPTAGNEDDTADEDGTADEAKTPEAPIPTKPKNKRKLLIIAAAIVLALLIAGGGVAWKFSSDAAAEQAATVAAEKAADKAAIEAKRIADAKAAADKAERSARQTAVVGIEASVKTMAEGHVADGILDGPIIDVTCSPVGGGSTDDLTEQTTVFDCFVANKDNGDGTMSGYYYNATMNWTTGSYTYGMGRN